MQKTPRTWPGNALLLTLGCVMRECLAFSQCPGVGSSLAFLPKDVGLLRKPARAAATVGVRGACMLWAESEGDGGHGDISERNNRRRQTTDEDGGVLGALRGLQEGARHGNVSAAGGGWSATEKMRVHQMLFDNRPPGTPYTPPTALGETLGEATGASMASGDAVESVGTPTRSRRQGSMMPDGSEASGLLGALSGSVKDNLLQQIMTTTAQDKRAMGEVEQLVRVVNALTSSPTEGGCPWTAEQDAMGIVEHCKGELEEIAEEIVLGDAAKQQALESELGDLLFNTMLLIKLCERDGLGGATLEGAAASATAKLRRRAPFIFGEGTHPQTPAQANAIWKAVKKKEKAGLIDTKPLLLKSPLSLLTFGDDLGPQGAGQASRRQDGDKSGDHS